MKKNRVYIIIALWIGAVLTSCTTGPKVTTTLHNDEQVIAAKTERVYAKEPYRLGFGDVIEVKFFKNPEYNETVAVRPDGKISLQRIGDVNVLGKTIQQLDDLVTRVYAEILIEPDVTIILREFGGQEVYVMGEVENPGSVSLTKGLSVLRAIASAGGPKNSAKMNSVILIRANEAANLTATRLDLTPSNVQLLMQNDKETTSFDLIYVPKTFVKDVDEFLTGIYNVILPPIDVLSRWTWYTNLLAE